jgi:hypothetical protein
MTEQTTHSRSSDRRASPLAVIGAIGLVALAIFFGVLGPQINNRGNVILGPSLDELLSGSFDYFDRERTALRPIAMVAEVDVDSIRTELLRRFDDRAAYIEFDDSGFKPIQLDTLQPTDQTDQSMLVVLYAPIDELIRQNRFTALIYIDDSQRRIAEDRFGVPMVMEPGVIYRSRLGRAEPGQDVWSASWYEGSVLHVLLAESAAQLENMLGSVNKAPSIEPDRSEVSGAIAGSAFDPSLLQGRLA